MRMQDPDDNATPQVGTRGWFFNVGHPVHQGQPGDAIRYDPACGCELIEQLLATSVRSDLPCVRIA